MLQVLRNSVTDFIFLPLKTPLFLREIFILLMVKPPDFNMAFCWKCGSKVETVADAPVKHLGAAPLYLDCTACRTATSMVATKVPRFSNIVRVIGAVLLIPSLLGFLFTALMFLSTVLTTASMPAARSDAEEAGRAIGFGIGFVFTIFCGVVSLVGGLVGWLLLLTRSVWKCSRCGFILDRA